MASSEQRPGRLAQIGELAQRTGVNPKTIRYYEQVGLMPEAVRSPAGFRLYGDVDAERLRFIKGVQQLGFSLGEIGEILALRDTGHPPCDYVVGRLERRSEEVDRQIADLKKLKGELAELRQRARTLKVHAPAPGSYCHILETVS